MEEGRQTPDLPEQRRWGASRHAGGPHRATTFYDIGEGRGAIVRTTFYDLVRAHVHLGSRPVPKALSPRPSGVRQGLGRAWAPLHGLAHAVAIRSEPRSRGAGGRWPDGGAGRLPSKTENDRSTISVPRHSGPRRKGERQPCAMLLSVGSASSGGEREQGRIVPKAPGADQSTRRALATRQSLAGAKRGAFGVGGESAEQRYS